MVLKPPASPESVFHHTNAHGLIGIIQSDRLWATEASSLNDHAEMLQGWRFTEGWLESRPHDPIHDAMRSIAASVDENSAQREIYVLAASSRRDDASQWRLYGDSGCGYSVELDTATRFHVVSQLEDQPASNRSRSMWTQFVEVSRWTEVIYQATEKEALLESIAKDHKEQMVRLSNLPAVDSDEAWESFQDDLYIALHEAVARFKEPGFAGEHERRIICKRIWSHNLTRHRATGYGVAPYLELGTHENATVDQGVISSGVAGKLPIRSITLGPLLRESNVGAVRSLLSAHGYTKVEIERSDLPLR